jgi:hypothetical protein
MVLIMSLKVNQETITYAPVTVPENHWALECPNQDNDNYVTVITTRFGNYYVYLNPTDSRGYRLIVKLFDPKDMRSTLNRTYTNDELAGLALVSALVMNTISNHFNLVGQLSYAGNNSHTFQDGNFVVGEQEPSMAHMHIIFRGNPNHEYLKYDGKEYGINLGGPVPGAMYNMRGDSKDENDEGNKKKEKWQIFENGQVSAIKDVASYFRNLLNDVNFSM